MTLLKPKYKSESRYGKWWYAPHHRLKRLISRAVYHLSYCLLRPKHRQPKIPVADIKRILLIRYDVLGDMAVTMPLISAFHTANPAIKIDVIASTRNRFLIDGDRRVHKVILFQEHPAFWVKVWSLRQNNYDLIFSFIDRKPIRQALIGHLAGTRHTLRVSIMRPLKYRAFFDKTIRLTGQSFQHVARRYLHLANEVVEFGKDVLNTPIRLDYSPSGVVEAFLEKNTLNRREFVVVNISAGREATKWTTQNFIDLITALRQGQAYPIVLVSTQADAADAAKIHEAVNDNRVVIFPPTKNIFEIVELLSRSLMLITPDTGVVHLASAAQTPVVALYTNIQSGKTAEWTPYQVPHRLVIAPEDALVADIPAQMVFDAVASLLDELRALQPPVISSA